MGPSRRDAALGPKTAIWRKRKARMVRSAYGDLENRADLRGSGGAEGIEPLTS